MDGTTMTKTLRKRWLLSWASVAGVVILLIYLFVHGFLSFRGFGIAVLVLCVTYATATVLIIKKSAKEVSVLLTGPVDPATRTLLSRGIRRAKTRIVIMGGALALALIQINDFPVLPLLVGLTMNLLITAQSVQTVVRLRKILDRTQNSEPSDILVGTDH